MIEPATEQVMAEVPRAGAEETRDGLLRLLPGCQVVEILDAQLEQVAALDESTKPCQVGGAVGHQLRADVGVEAHETPE